MLPKYFKITNDDECHNGYLYKNGLNVLDKPFDKHGNCTPGGLYFAKRKHIHNYYDFGVNLRVIHLPIHDKKFKMVKDDDKYRANKIILGEKYSLYDISTYIQFNIPYPQIDNEIYDNLPICNHKKLVKIIDYAYDNYDISTMKWFKNNKSVLKMKDKTKKVLKQYLKKYKKLALKNGITKH